MRRIGIRELRQNASKYIRLVKAGETIEVTERGVPVACLKPLEEAVESPYERLKREGKVREGTQDWASLKPLPPVPENQP
ncbi:MAG: type II toxin-antitoxin system Phd/YefM family antitoxin [Dehalococcoidia bacterium]